MKYFYYRRLIMGKWGATLDTNYPGKGAEKTAPKIHPIGVITLEPEDEGISLVQAMEKWPLPKEDM